MAVLVISFAATTLDTATRIQRFVIGEIGAAVSVPALENRWIATLLAVVPAIVLAFWEVRDPASGQMRAAGWVLWPIFGASNQMLAALTLLVLTLYFSARKRPVLPLLLPMIFVSAVTFLAMLANLREFWAAGNVLLAALSAVLLALNAWMLAEGAGALRKRLRRSRDG